MKALLTAVTAGCILASSAFAADSKTFIDIENAWAKAYVAKDTAAIGGALSDEWIGQSDGTSRYSKADFIADIKSGKLAYKAITLRDMKVRVFGTTAVVQGYDDEKSSWGKTDTSGSYSWIDVFVSKGGKWVAVASQVTKVKK